MASAFEHCMFCSALHNASEQCTSNYIKPSKMAVYPEDLITQNANAQFEGSKHNLCQISNIHLRS